MKQKANRNKVYSNFDLSNKKDYLQYITSLTGRQVKASNAYIAIFKLFLSHGRFEICYFVDL